FDHHLDKAVAIKEYLPRDLATRSGDRSVMAYAQTEQSDFRWGLERFLDEARAHAADAAGRAEGAAAGGGPSFRVLATRRHRREGLATGQARAPGTLRRKAARRHRAAVADRGWARALRTENAVSGWHDARDLRARGLYCPARRAGAPAPRERHSLSRRVRLLAPGLAPD